MVFGLFVGILPATAGASTSEGLPAGNTLTLDEANDLLQASTGKTLVEIALENEYLKYDTIDMCGGNSHLQGICVDDEMKYMYFSYTSALAKLDMETGTVVASVGGFGQGSFGTSGGAHLGCLAYYDGWVYGSLEYKKPGKKFFVAAFDASKITEIGMDIKSDTFTEGVTGILLKEPTEDFRDPIDTTIFTGQDDEGHATNEANNGHRFACSGIDGVTFGTIPGDTSGKMYLIVAYGVYAFSSINRYDNTYNVLRFYDVEDFWDSTNKQPVGTQNIRFTYERGLSSAYDESEMLEAADTLYVYTGNTSYGVQNLEYEKDTGDIVLYTYGNTDGMGSTMYVVDGSKAPETKILELGQNNTLSDATQQAYAKSIADAYSVDADESGVIEDDERLTGKVAVLKCICGNEAGHSADSVGDAKWGTTGVAKADQPICSRSKPYKADTGIAHIGGHTEDGLEVDYFYIADGSTNAGLYKRTTAANGSMSYEAVTPSVKAKMLLHYSMDAEDMYVDTDGSVYLKNTASDTEGRYDALVEGTTSAAGVSGGEGSSLSFDAWKYPDQVDRVYLSEETIAYINQQIDAASGQGNYSFSFWAKMPVGKESDGNFIPFIGFYREDGTYASVFEKRWRSSMGHVTNGIGDAGPGAGNISSDVYNPSNNNPGDSNTYLGGYGAVYPKDTGWHFYTVTEYAGVVTVYYDGVKLFDKTVTANHLASEPFAHFEIGGGVEKLWQDMNNRGRYIGEIDDVTIYSGVLTADQVAAAYAAKPVDAATNPAHPGVDTSTPAAAEFAPAYPVYDKTGDNGDTLTVTAGKAVSEVSALDSTKVTISGDTIVFSASYLAGLKCGIYDLTVKYTDGSTAVLKLTITDRQVPVLNYALNSISVRNSVVTDSSVYKVDAITTASEFAVNRDGISSGALVFDGYDYNEPTYVKLSDEDAKWLNSVLKDGYTINFWANAGAENGNKMIFAGLYASDARPLGVVETNDANGSNSKIDGKMTIQANVGISGTSGANAVSGTQVATNTWAMYTLTYANGALTLYINGVKVSDTAVTSSVLGQIDQMYIGHQYQKYYYNNTSTTRDWTTRGGFYGAMDSYSVYNYALSADEVTTLFSTPAEKPSAILHWTMDASTLSGDGTILESANGFTSYYQNVTAVAGVDGKDGGALYFDGAADSGEAARVWLGEDGIAALNDLISNQVTMSFWMKADTAKTNEDLAYTAAWSPVAGIYGTDTRFLMVAEYRGGTLNYCATIPGLSDQRINSNTVTPANGEWYFVVMTWDGNTTETVAGAESYLRRIYVFKPDGTVVVGTPNRAAKTSVAASGELFDSIGHIEVGGQNSKGYWSDTNVRGRFVGAIDDVQVYNIPFVEAEAKALYAKTPVTGDELYLPEYQFEFSISEASDLTFSAENAGELIAVSGLTAGEFSMDNGVVTLKHEAVADLEPGSNLLTLTFVNGTCTIRVTVIDDRRYFDADTTIFDKAAPADMTFSIKESFGSVVKSVSAIGLTTADYTVSGREVTIKQDWLIQQQPGAVEITVTVDGGETHVMTLNVTNALSDSTTEPYPVLYYKFDGSDLIAGEPSVNGAAAGIIKDQSGNGIDLRYGGLTTTGSNKDQTADSATFFDGYRDYDVSRAWLDKAGMEYLKDAVSDQITISFWHMSSRITSNYMPVLGLFAEDDRPLIMAEFRATGGERSGSDPTAKKGTNPVPTLTATPAGSVALDDGVLKSSSTVTVGSTWRHYVVTYNNTTGEAAIYVNGAQMASGTLSAGQLDDMAKFEIGGMTNAEYYDLGTAAKHTMSTQSHGRLYGYLDELKVYNVVLTTEDVADLYATDVDAILPEDSTGVKTLDSIEIAAPTKTEYTVGEPLDVTGGKVTAKYTDGTSKTFDLTEDMVSDFDSAEAEADQVLTITHTHRDVTKTATFTVNIIDDDTDPGTNSRAIPGGSSGSGSVVGIGGTDTVTCNCHKFSDIDPAQWYHEAVCYALFNNIMNGTGDGTTFSVYMNLSRAMMWTMLARLDGVNTEGGSPWYEKGMQWAMAENVSDGTNPNADITREQMITMLYRFIGSPATGDSHLAGFPDGDKVSSWAFDAMNWAVDKGIIKGDGNGNLNPQGVATRAEVAQILTNYLKNK